MSSSLLHEVRISAFCKASEATAVCVFLLFHRIIAEATRIQYVVSVCRALLFEFLLLLSLFRGRRPRGGLRQFYSVFSGLKAYKSPREVGGQS